MTVTADPTEYTEADWVASLPRFRPPIPPGSPRLVVLSPMLANVLESLCEGKSNKGIGVDWGIAEDTVKTHIRRLLARLGARDRAHAAALVAFGVVDVRIGKMHARRTPARGAGQS